jgi:dihydrofolate synthase/folylpolyglutamate synthase
MTSHRELADWLQFIGSQHHKEMELGLARIQRVAGHLGLEKFDCPVITVAGTNGKGSSVAMLESIYLAAGYRTCAYTSPHLTVFNERIRVAGAFCSDADLCDAFARIDSNRSGIALTYFEFATLAALLIFSEAEPDVVILEVGLGGRLDAVNIMAPDVSLITRVGIDHTDWLGDDREAIGREKAGIIHPTSMAVISDTEPPLSVTRAAGNTARASFFLGPHFSYEKQDDHWHWIHGDHGIDGLPPPGTGQAQFNNASGVLMAIAILQDRLTVTDADIRKGLAEMKLAGRFQVIDGEPKVILDVAHNEDSAALLADNLSSDDCAGRTLAVCGMLADKDIDAAMEKMVSLVDHWYTGGLDAARSASGEELARILVRNGATDVSQFNRIESSWAAARADASGDDRIVVFGSFHTVGAIISIFPSDNA